MNFIQELLKNNQTLHFTLIDPENQDPKQAGYRTRLCESYGTDAIMVGGSTTRDRKSMYNTIDAIKKEVKIPVIIFPNSAETISENADYIFFMSLLNSRQDRYLIEEQLKGVPLINEWGVEPISMAYLVISTSEIPTTVESRVKLDKIQGNDIEKAVNYALIAKIWGFDCLYLEAGSNADKPVPNEMIQAIRDAVDIPIIVGGGIRDAKTALEKANAGADIIVNGTLSEEDPTKIKEIIEKIKS